MPKPNWRYTDKFVVRCEQLERMLSRLILALENADELPNESEAFVLIQQARRLLATDWRKTKLPRD